MIAIDRHAPDEIAAKIEELGLPRERLWIGVGAGFSKKPLTAMRERCPPCATRSATSASSWRRWARRCARFAGAEFDGVFFNWMTPGFAAGAREHVERGAAEAGREPRRSSATSAQPSATTRRSASRRRRRFYRELHDGYRNHFARLGEPDGTVGVAEPGRRRRPNELGEFDALDITVVRGLASANLEAMSTLAEAAAP